MDLTNGLSFSDFLHEQFLTARERGKETSLSDFPVDILIVILNFAAASSRSTAASLALTSSWVSDVTLEGRWKHSSVLYRHYEDGESSREMAQVYSSTRISSAVRTLWFDPGGYYYWNCSCICDILERYPNLEALACEAVMLEASSCASKTLPRTSIRLKLLDPTDGRWNRIVQNPSGHGARILRTITHLHLRQTLRSVDALPVEHLPNLTHFAMGSSELGFTQPGPVVEIRNFALSLDNRLLCLEAAVLILPHLRYVHVSPQEVIQTARQYSVKSKIMVYFVSLSQRESRFWAGLVRSGDDIWTAAEKQMDENNWPHHPLLTVPADNTVV
ncbi:hypothetical protein B0H16DRAFT_1610614 [Mycena metata]|uniref:Uncharacterized protein n=1 Tax=Mycena metata TaxID=1033252 RepID=A0AAD7HCP9_9AGAR|nr:hypothetical protein B0H16DRAFT_1610614 [Mycena metata]